MGFHFYKTGISLWCDVFSHIKIQSRLARTLFVKCMCDISKDCKKAFHEKRIKNISQINELIELYLVKNTKTTKMLHTAMKIWARESNYL